MQNKEENSQKILQVLDWAYEKSVNGLPGADTAIELAESFLSEEGTCLVEKTNSLIKLQISKITTSGSLTDLEGFVTLPDAMPANVIGVVYEQIRMIAAIAHMGGFDINNDRVKALVYICLTGKQAKEILKNIGIQFGAKFSNNTIHRSVTGTALIEINEEVGFRLVSKIGTTSEIALGKAIPVLSGIIGGTFDGATTNTVGNVARDLFIPKQTTDTETKTMYVKPVDPHMDEVIKEIINLEIQQLYSYINLIKIDGQIKIEEVEFLESFVNESDLSDEQKMYIIEKISSPSMIDVNYGAFKKEPEKGLKLINNLILISKIDGELHPTEKMFIKNVANQVGLEVEEVVKLFKD